MVLFFNLKCWESVFPILSNLARSLQERGVETHQIICPPGWRCDALRPVKPDPPNCSWGRERLEGGLREADLAYTSAEQYCNPEVRQRCSKLAESLFRETRPAYDGILLDEVIRASLARYLRCLFDASNPRHQVARFEFIRDALCWIETAARILDEWQPEAIVIWGGTFYAERIAAILAKRRGIRVIAVENTAFRDRIYVDSAGVTGNRHTAAHNWHWLEARALLPEERRRLHEYLTSVHAGATSWMPHSEPVGRKQICDFMGIDSERRLALLIGQVAVDSVVLMDSPVFPDMREFIIITAEIISRHPEYHLVIRLHPAEEMWHDNLTLRRLGDWKPPANCSIVHSRQLNTYDLMRESELGITLCSQAGLEMLSMGKPVVTAGQAFYAGKGLTYDVPSRAAYQAVLEDALREPRLDEAQRDGIEKLLYYLIFEHLIPFDRQSLSITPEAADLLVSRGAFRGLANLESSLHLRSTASFA
jgi:hypothetical protein